MAGLGPGRLLRLRGDHRRRRQRAGPLLDRPGAHRRRRSRRRPTATATACPMPGKSAYGVSNPSADDDSDGVTNLQEYQRGTNPRLSNTWTLAEGATGFFAERLALANPDAAPADVVDHVPAAGAEPADRHGSYSLLPYGRADDQRQRGRRPQRRRRVAVVTAITGGVVAERTMFWGDQWYGGHTGKAIQQAGTTWYLAEGAANNFFAHVHPAGQPGQRDGDRDADVPARAVAARSPRRYSVARQLAGDHLHQRLHRQRRRARAVRPLVLDAHHERPADRGRAGDVLHQQRRGRGTAATKRRPCRRRRRSGSWPKARPAASSRRSCCSPTRTRRR